MISPIIASLAAGNAIVVKPSEMVAWSSHIYADAVRACLAACGEDPDLVQIVVTLPDSVEALTGDARLKHITFVRRLQSLRLTTALITDESSKRSAPKKSARRSRSRAPRLARPSSSSSAAKTPPSCAHLPTSMPLPTLGCVLSFR